MIIDKSVKGAGNYSISISQSVKNPFFKYLLLSETLGKKKFGHFVLVFGNKECSQVLYKVRIIIIIIIIASFNQ